MKGVNIREIQTLMGHQNVETTMINTHVMRDMTTAPKNPLDLLLEGSSKPSESGDAYRMFIAVHPDVSGWIGDRIHRESH
jgi:hypothetical protein